MKKRIVSLLICVLLCISTFVGFSKENIYAGSGSVTMSLSAGSVISGDQITVNIGFNLSADIFFGQFNVEYDTDKFEYVSASGDFTPFTGTPSGSIPYNLDIPTAGVTKVNVSIVFKAKNVGTGNITVKNAVFAVNGADVESVNIPDKAVSATIMAPGSDDATLSSIVVAGANLNPGFAKWTLDYVCYVDNSVTAVNLGATSSQGGKVEITGNYSNLQVGSNFVKINSYAPNGKVMSYNLNIYRLEPPTEPPTTEAPPEDVEITVDGEKVTISSEFLDEKIPEGFTKVKEKYKNDEIYMVKNEETGLTLIYLVNSNGDGAFYICDNDEFYKYHKLVLNEKTYIIYDSRKAENVPNGKEGTVVVLDEVIKGITDSENHEFIYFYAMNQEGSFNWYCFDTVENTIQRMHGTSFSDKKEDETTNEEETTGENVTTEDAKPQKGNKINYREILIIAIVVLFVIAVALIVVICVKKTKPTDADEEDAAVEYAPTTEEAQAEENTVEFAETDEDLDLAAAIEKATLEGEDEEEVEDTTEE